MPVCHFKLKRGDGANHISQAHEPLTNVHIAESRCSLHQRNCSWAVLGTVFYGYILTMWCTFAGNELEYRIMAEGPIEPYLKHFFPIWATIRTTFASTEMNGASFEVNIFKRWMSDLMQH